MINKLKVVVCMLTYTFVTSVHAQAPESVTNSLVNNTTSATAVTSTWQNVGTINQPITCWAPGDAGYCGPLPYANGFGPNGLNFSYGVSDAFQNVNVAKALPNSGTGLITTGFKFSWMSKNGNGWDDERLDQLSAYVNLYDKSNSKVLENFYWNLNYIHNWTTFDIDKNWSKEYRPNDIGNVRFGFVGGDNNFWAGPYGPEITNINFQLKYKPDPCIKNPLYSPECPNFMKELEKNSSTNTTTSTNSTTNTSSNDLPPPENDQNKNNPPKDEKFDLAQKEEGVNENVDHEEPLNNSIDKLVNTLIKIQDNQAKEEKLTMDASKDAINENDNITKQTVKNAEQVASRAVRLSQEISTQQQQVSMDVVTKDNKSQQSLSLFVTPTATTLSAFQLPNATQQFNSIQNPMQNNQATAQLLTTEQPTIKTQSSNLSMTNNLVQTETTVSVFAPLQTITQQNLQSTSVNTAIINQNALINPLANQVTETPTLSTSFLTNKADPINSIIEAKNTIEDKKEEVNTAAVKPSVQDNDAAGGVSINSIAVTPVGFNAYNVALRDVAFYAPKEIYRNQRTVDNIRALRQLASDRLHQEMVDQQYRR
jgi:hypothetical protein